MAVLFWMQFYQYQGADRQLLIELHPEQHRHNYAIPGAVDADQYISIDYRCMHTCMYRCHSP